MIIDRRPSRAAAVLLGLMLAACAGGEMTGENAPTVTVKGRIAAEDGGAVSGCRLELYDTAALKPALIRDVAQSFSVQIQSKTLLQDFYFRTRCDGYRMPARSAIFDADDLSHRDYRIDLGSIVVGQGTVTITGEAPSAPCRLGLYTGFHRDPVRSWDVEGAFSVTFERRDVETHFRLEISCAGLTGAYKSVTRPESWLDETGGTIRLGKVTLR